MPPEALSPEDPREWLRRGRSGRLGPYEILSPLGSGGMGEVYKARDPRLNRLIAIKVLPAAAAADAERRERFDREAQVIAALNHPHIVTIHSVEEADGQFFLTMELVEGRSLAEALPKSGLPLDGLLTMAIPIADAMAAAHQKGITHRDLKPANVMLGEGEHHGRVKVLDFGLAKLADTPVTAVGVTALPTAAITGEGRILGTVAYMSPEQAEGKPIDARSDLFSLGVMLYEMATGQRPFIGDTSISIISSIIKDTPRSVTEVNPQLPRDLGRIIRRALMKDPERRYQSAKDLRNDLEELKASLDSGELVAPVTDAPAAARRGGWLATRLRRALAIAAVAAVLGIGGGMYALMHRRTASAAITSAAPTLQDLQVTQLTTSGNAERPTISPDGKYVAYVQHDGDEYSLWIRQTTTASNVRIVAPEIGVTLLGATFTPDGSFVDFVRQTSGAAADVWRVPFLGGTPKLLISGVGTPIGWSPDGQHLAYLRFDAAAISSRLMIADADGSHERELAARRLPTIFLTFAAPWRPSIAPAWSLDGRVIAVGGVDRSGETFKAQVHLVEVATGSIRSVPCPCGLTFGLAWLDSESLVLDQAVGPTQLWRLSYPAATTSRLTNDTNNYVGVSTTADHSNLVTARQERRMDIWEGDAAASSGTDVAQRVVVSNVSSLAWAADRILYEGTVGGHSTIVRLTPGTGMPEEIARDAISPAATSDGRTILLTSIDPNGVAALWTADPSGRRSIGLATGLTGLQPAVTPDDRAVIFGSFAGGSQSLSMVPIGGGPPVQIVNGAVSDADVSPDGASIVFSAVDAQGRGVVTVCDLPTCSSRRTVPFAESQAPRRWTPDGRGIAYASMGNLWVQPLDGKPPRQLTHFTDGHAVGSFAWSHDGKRLAIGRLTVTNDIVLFKGLKR